MNTWLQVVLTVVSIVGGALAAWKQLRSRSQPVSGPHGHEKRPTLNGLAVYLRQATEQIEQLRHENEQLRIENAELKARAEARRTTSRSRNKSAAITK